MKIQALAYIVAESTDVAQWRHYAEQVLGAATTSANGGALYVKLDERVHRMLIVPGAADRYVASGWETTSAQAFTEAVAALRQAGIAVHEGSDAERALRCVQRMAVFTDPSGNRHELVHGYTGGSVPFVSPIGVGGFKTGAQGMGHTVLPAVGAFDATVKLFREVLGFGLSDVFNFRPAPDAPVIRIHFLHASSGRHHSLAFAEMPAPSGCVHVMVEVLSMTDVGLALERREKHGIKLMATLGEHENDRMTSFYMMTPGNFALEYGWGGISVDPQTWKATETQRVSVWGHDFSVGFR
ncbi:3,4-dihydroxy-9,10-secoandrosta-1,3,5(10)-triene-9,17-dione 4,5-dioxygenase [Fontimonas thermophila]|uniref:3,4-dihydroxy-9,10-secoandrosta-1,3,5(10)-triene-9,17-dione 4,5-dioxygenase n=1 Tax=Fontimonas thermophila TaxID=1076937 RepID=A0A1I2JTK4_9GAMM|nr:VOC family protein [Fontimonas thermophila]SFF57270.1 3,4-dihydroxy-9,10-secoandrosta-1,3,5(10)-triene-9,17-dione 4,5-dioxygenase [Fontimonas thermophila]